MPVRRYSAIGQVIRGQCPANSYPKRVGRFVAIPGTTRRRQPVRTINRVGHWSGDRLRMQRFGMCPATGWAVAYRNRRSPFSLVPVKPPGWGTSIAATLLASAARPPQFGRSGDLPPDFRLSLCGFGAPIRACMVVERVTKARNSEHGWVVPSREFAFSARSVAMFAARQNQ